MTEANIVSLAVLQADGAALHEALLEIHSQNPDRLAKELLPATVECLPVRSLNFLIDEGILISPAEAVEYTGYASRNTLYTAAEASYPLKNVKVGSTRGVYYTRAWLDDYMANKAGPGRPTG